jgi:release factor glutamine methyltransferase
MTVREALSYEGTRLKKAGIETSSLDASILLCFILNCNRADILAASFNALDEVQTSSFHSLINRRLKGEPVAYITGSKEFRYLDFTVNPSVLIPRPDTETLVETARNLMEKDKKNIHLLDLCTGSGAVAVALKHEVPKMKVYAADISKEALELARLNARRHIKDCEIHFYHGDLFDAIPPDHPLFSIIVSNPPYVKTGEINTLSAEVRAEPPIALDGGKTGLEIITRIIEKAGEYLIPAGVLLLEASPEQMKEITSLLDKNGFKDIQLYKDLSGQDRVIGGRFEA